MRDLLEQIKAQLHEDATNYSVFLRAYDVPYSQPTHSHALIRAGLGAEAALGGIDEVEASVVCAEVADALCYPGNDGAGPGDAALQSASFVDMVDALTGELLQLASASHRIQRFWLRDGYPAYPVFWDFAFLFWAKDNATIFIGTASD